jgi:hypothetical protein
MWDYCGVKLLSVRNISYPSVTESDLGNIYVNVRMVHSWENIKLKKIGHMSMWLIQFERSVTISGLLIFLGD